MKHIIEKTPKMQSIESQQGTEIEEILRKSFVDENKSIHEIAEELRISYPVVLSWLRQAGIYSRKLHIE